MHAATADWKSTARGMLPGLAAEVEEAETPYVLWLALYQAFRRAYEGPRPDEAVVGPIYGYAAWCLGQPRAEAMEDDLTTCVCLCFYQNLPLLESARKDLARWLSPSEFARLVEVLRFHSDPEVFEELARPFRANPADGGGTW